MDGGISRSVLLSHPLDNQGVPEPHKCHVQIRIKRSPVVYFVKGIVLTIAVVLGSVLTSVYLHPEEHIGDRAAVLFIAFLILITNMQADLGLGRVTCAWRRSNRRPVAGPQREGGEGEGERGRGP